MGLEPLSFPCHPCRVHPLSSLSPSWPLSLSFKKKPPLMWWQLNTGLGCRGIQIVVVVMERAAAVRVTTWSCDLLRVGSHDFKKKFSPVMRAHPPQGAWTSSPKYDNCLDHDDGHASHQSQQHFNQLWAPLNASKWRWQQQQQQQQWLGLETRHLSSCWYVFLFFYFVFFISPNVFFRFIYHVKLAMTAATVEQQWQGLRRDMSRAAGMSLFF